MLSLVLTSAGIVISQLFWIRYQNQKEVLNIKCRVSATTHPLQMNGMVLNQYCGFFIRKRLKLFPLRVRYEINHEFLSREHKVISGLSLITIANKKLLKSRSAAEEKAQEFDCLLRLRYSA